MPTIRAQVTIPMFTNIPSDVITNTLHFEETVPATLEEAGDALNPLIKAFYEQIYQTDRMANYCLPLLSTVRYYRMDQPPPRVPYELSLPLSIGSLTNSQLPTETSMVISFQGDRVGGEPQARRRGRIYIGGLSNAAMVASSTSLFPAFGSGIRNSAVSAAETLMGASATANLVWSVWSSVDQEAVHITNGWVDNTPDTQRRRGVDATIRTVFPV